MAALGQNAAGTGRSLAEAAEDAVDTELIEILLVEDEPAHAELVRRAFESETGRMRLTVAGSLKQARACIAAAPPQLVIADLRLPDGQGIELLLAGREDPPYPLIMITGQGDQQQAVEAMKSGALDYVVKTSAILEGMPRIAQRALREWDHIRTERRMEQQLRVLNDSLLEAQRIAHLGNWDWDIVNNTLFWSDEVYRIFGLTPQQFGANYDAFLDAIHPDDVQRVTQAVDEALHRGKPYMVEHRVVRPDGMVRIVHEQGEVTYSDEGKPMRMIGSVHDITERKQSEQLVTRERDFSDAIISGLPGVMFLFDREGKFLRWNEQLEQVTGNSAAEIAALSPLQMIGERHRSLTGQRIEAVFRDGKAELSANLLAKDGRETAYFFTGQRILFDGNPCLLGVGIDISERQRARDALEDALARMRALSERVVTVQEEERSRIAYELHDEIGQTLTAAKIHLQGMEQRCQGCTLPFSVEHMEEALLMVSRTLEQVRALSLDLRPMQLDDFGLEVALRTQLERQAAAAGWKTHFDSNLGSERLAPAIELACYRVAQEALTNILRHARATEVWLSLMRNNAELICAVRDDGAGFDTQGIQGAARIISLGLLGIEERAKSSGGSVEIRSQPGAGTEIRASFPIAAGDAPGGAVAGAH